MTTFTRGKAVGWLSLKLAGIGREWRTELALVSSHYIVNGLAIAISVYSMCLGCVEERYAVPAAASSCGARSNTSVCMVVVLNEVRVRLHSFL